MSDDPDFDAHCQRNDAARKAEPIGSDDTWERLDRIEKAMGDKRLTQDERDMLHREWIRLASSLRRKSRAA